MIGLKRLFARAFVVVGYLMGTVVLPVWLIREFVANVFWNALKKAEYFLAAFALAFIGCFYLLILLALCGYAVGEDK